MFNILQHHPLVIECLYIYIYINVYLTQNKKENLIRQEYD